MRSLLSIVRYVSDDSFSSEMSRFANCSWVAWEGGQGEGLRKGGRRKGGQEERTGEGGQGERLRGGGGRVDREKEGRVREE